MIIISGRSGSGKSTALNQLEDEGYYCIDNLPVSLLPALVEEASGEDFRHFRGTAVCIDARNAWKDLADFSRVMQSLPATVSTEILFLDAQESALIKRFSETRRKHPLSSEHHAAGRGHRPGTACCWNPSPAVASLVLDTSQMTIYELARRNQAAPAGGCTERHYVGV